MDMGYADHGGGPPDPMAAMRLGAHHAMPMGSVTSFIAHPNPPIDVAVTLTAPKPRTLPSLSNPCK
jgi:hypothetical protein